MVVGKKIQNLLFKMKNQKPTGHYLCLLILSGYETKRCVVQRKIKLRVAHLSTFERVNKDYETPEKE